MEPTAAETLEAPPRRRRTRPSRRRTGARAFTVSVKRTSREQLRIGLALYPPDEFAGVPRPRMRADCLGADRPCPYVGCKYHLFLDVSPLTGSVKYNFPDKEPDELAETCALDVADRGGATLDDVGVLYNLTRERVRQIEVRALAKLSNVGGLDELREAIEDGTPFAIEPAACTPASDRAASPPVVRAPPVLQSDAGRGSMSLEETEDAAAMPPREDEVPDDDAGLDDVVEMLERKVKTLRDAREHAKSEVARIGRDLARVAKMLRAARGPGAGGEAKPNGASTAAAPATMAQRVVKALEDADAPMRAADIAEAVGGSYGALTGLLSVLVRDKKIRREGRGVYVAK